MRVRGSRMGPFRRGFNRPRASSGDFDTAARRGLHLTAPSESLYDFGAVFRCISLAA